MKNVWLLPLVGFLGFGCQSQTTGNEGNLVFSYTADDNLTDFNKPIAVGAKLDVRVRASGSNVPTPLTAAFTDDQDVLRVVSFETNSLTLEGVSPGNTLVQVEAQLTSGDVVTDSVNMRAAEATRLELKHSCALSNETEFTYLAGTQDIFLPFDLFTANDEPAIGYGLFPITISPESGFELDRSSRNQAAFRANLGEAGSVQVSSTIDDSEVTLNLVDVADVDGAELSPGYAQTGILIGQTSFVHVSPTVQGAQVCQAKTSMLAESLTPEICDVGVPGVVDEEEQAFETLFVRIEGKSLGDCDFTVTFPQGGGGEGATSTLSVSIGEVP